MFHFKLAERRVQLFGYIFCPKLFPTFVTMLSLPLLLKLGFWQLDRAEQKNAIQHKVSVGLNAKPLTLDQLHNYPIANLHYHPATVVGFYDNQHQLLLDNKVYHHRVGYHVLTPLFIPKEKQWLLIDRGWVPAKDRTHLPVIPQLPGKQIIAGIIDIPNAKPFLLDQNEQYEGNWPLRIQAIMLPQLEKKLNKPLYPFVLVQTNNTSGFIQDWQPIALPPYRHMGYAVQWFALAATLGVVYIMTNIKKAVKNHDLEA
jgi:surfeit locus 1 family protein